MTVANLSPQRSSSLSASASDAAGATCRLCGHSLENVILDLGMSPLCQTVKPPHAIDQPELFYPLRVFLCENCWLVQLREYVAPQTIFGDDYPYFSSFSDSWLAHARNYAETMIARLGLNESTHVVEVASNDGYLLKNFVKRGIPALGIEPARSVAEAAREQGVPTVQRFFGREVAQELVSAGTRAHLLLGNNVLAHVPNLDDFVAGLSILLHPQGVLTMEFPHLLELMRGNQFDTIYHEHFSYLTLGTVELAFARHGLSIFDVERLATHGGSLRVFAQGREGKHAVHARVGELREMEAAAKLTDLATYEGFAKQVEKTKRGILQFLIDAQAAGKRVAGYGAPGKGVTLLHYCGINSDFLAYTVDRSPYKQGHFMPGTSIAIRPPEVIAQDRPDYLFILPWNLCKEIMQQQHTIRDWGGKFVIPIPAVEVV